MNLFLQAAYKVIDVPLHSCYDIAKDFIVPSIVVLITGGAAIYAVHRHFILDDKKNDANQKKEILLLNRLIILNHPSLIEKIDAYQKSISDFKNELSIDKFVNFKFHVMSLTNFSVIKDFGYLKVSKLINSSKPDEMETFSAFWIAIDSTITSYTELNEHFKYTDKMYSETNEKLNLLTEQISVTTTNNIHNEFPPFTTIKFSDKDLITNSKLRLAFMSKNIADEFRNSKELNLPKLKTFLKKLYKLKDDKAISHEVSTSYIQKIESALGHIKEIEILLGNVRRSINAFSPIFKKNKEAIDNFNALISKNR